MCPLAHRLFPSQFPQIILPEPKVSFNMPPVPKVGPEIRFEGHPSLMPKIIPVLPEPLMTVEVPKGGMNTAPKVTTEITQKKVTLDLSQVRLGRQGSGKHPPAF